MTDLKGCGTKLSWPNLKILSRYLARVTEEKTCEISNNSRSPVRDLKLKPPE
jgi:hypothetical protein